MLIFPKIRTFAFQNAVIMKKTNVIRLISVGAILLVLCLLCATCCTVVDSSEVGIKFKKFDLTEQGTLKATPVSGWTFYNPITTSVYTYPVYIQRVDYTPFTVTTRDAAISRWTLSWPTSSTATRQPRSLRLTEGLSRILSKGI